ncbi:hypothetical protein CJ263_07865 [Maribacter cobaltidurans]|uniref:Uncharacterized protein n=1 Tax=Maribacter cobaltidurans TaxID=1178778 RepID=A0A223V4C6_9FLAO|nr:hypothetical protein CJ263_07865 [Maribacter cobaltidurans]
MVVVKGGPFGRKGHLNVRWQGEKNRGTIKRIPEYAGKPFNKAQIEFLPWKKRWNILLMCQKKMKRILILFLLFVHSQNGICNI